MHITFHKKARTTISFHLIFSPRYEVTVDDSRSGGIPCHTLLTVAGVFTVQGPELIIPSIPIPALPLPLPGNNGHARRQSGFRHTPGSPPSIYLHFADPGYWLARPG